MENETLAEKLEKPAAKIIKDLIHTVLHDIANDFIESGGDAKTVLEIVHKRAAMYAEGEIKIKKNPAPRTPKAINVESTLRKCRLLHLNGYASVTACSCTRIDH